jgi:hypothetical protein
MCVDVAAYLGFCLFALGVCVRVIVLDGMWLPSGQSDDTRYCNNIIWPPEDEHSIARNMSRTIMYYIIIE